MKYTRKFLLGIILMLVLTGCEEWPNFLDSSGPVAEKQAEIFWISHAFSVPVFFIVAGLLLYILFRFRRRPGGRVTSMSPSRETLVEIIYTAIPLLLVVLLFFLTIGYINAIDDPESGEDELTVRVIGNRWYWEYEYPDQRILVPDQLHVPVNTNVRLILESSDVIHSFWVPELAGKMDLIPGQTNEMWFRATEIGEYSGYCAEFCGIQHAMMRVKVVVDSREDFDAWISRMQQPPPIPGTELQQQGYDLIISPRCARCHSLGIKQDVPLLGPDLANISARSVFAGATYQVSEENLRQWLRDNQEMKPGNLMQGVELTEQEINALIAYFYLKPWGSEEAE